MLDGPSLLDSPQSRGGREKMGVHSSTNDETASSPLDVRKMMAFCGATYFLFMTAFIVPIACVTTVILFSPIAFISMPLFLRIENRLCRFVNDHWVAASAYSGLQVVEYGDDISCAEERRSLFLANHLGLVDHFVLMNCLHDRGSVPSRWMWVIYNIWKYTPLGAMWMSHGNFFVNGGPTKRARLLETFKEHLKTRFWSWDYRWIVMYPEGSRLYLVQDSGIKFAEKNNLPPLRHCIYPRTGAAHAVMEVAAPSPSDPSRARCGSSAPLEYVIDATLGYPKGQVADVGAALMGEWPLGESRIAIHYSLHKVDPAWADEEKLKEWLYTRYQKKDELLDHFYKTGEFPGGNGRIVQVNSWNILFSQLFWFGLYSIHHSLWLRPLFLYSLQSISSLIF